MERIICSAVALAVAFFTACNNPRYQEASGPGTDTADTAGKNVEYRLARNYFVRSDADLSGFSSLKIETQQAFDAIFGPATVMGDEGTPTPIDFNRKYAVAIINPVTDHDVALDVKQVEKAGDLITVTYSETSGEKQTMQTRPFLLLVLDKKDDGRVEVVREENP